MRPADTRTPVILVVYLGELTNIARVARHVQFLQEDNDVILAAWPPDPGLPGVRFVPLPAGGGTRLQAVGRVALRQAGRYDSAYWLDDRMRASRDRLAALPPVDAILVNHLSAVPLARAVAGGAPVVFDAHEHWTSESVSWTRRQRLSMRGAHEWITDRHVPAVAGMMTVSNGIARDFRERCGVAPRLVTNAPFFQELSPSPVGDPIRLVHVGLADPRRRLEDTIEAVAPLGERFSLDLILAREGAYRRSLEQLAARHDHIRVLPPVPSAELIAVANRYDVGVFLLPARTPNQIHVLPNKLFDYLQARLALAIGPSPEMAAIVREWDCGVVSSDFTPASFAAALASLDEPGVARMKQASARAARVLNAEQNRETVRAVVRDAIRAGA